VAWRKLLSARKWAEEEEDEEREEDLGDSAALTPSQVGLRIDFTLFQGLPRLSKTCQTQQVCLAGNEGTGKLGSTFSSCTREV